MFTKLNVLGKKISISSVREEYKLSLRREKIKQTLYQKRFQSSKKDTIYVNPLLLNIPDEMKKERITIEVYIFFIFLLRT